MKKRKKQAKETPQVQAPAEPAAEAAPAEELPPAPAALPQDLAITLEADEDEPKTQPYLQVPAFDVPHETLPAAAAPELDDAYGSNDPTVVTLDADPPPAALGDDAGWDGPTRVSPDDQLADLAAQTVQAEGQGGGELLSGAESEAADDEAPPVESPARLESIIESLLFAADRPLAVADLKRLLNERDSKKITTALEALKARHEETGIQLASLAGGWQFRTHTANAAWVAKLVAGRPQRLSRAMLETLAIVAYRQPITRPEMDEIRGVDCGPVLKTLLDRALVRMIGKKEDVGRPILYGTTPEFLRTFSLRDLTELPTLREFHELSEAHLAQVEAKAKAKADAEAQKEGTATGGAADSAAPAGDGPLSPPPARPPEPSRVDPDEEDNLLEELERATAAASKATATPDAPARDGAAEGAVADAPEAQ